MFDAPLLDPGRPDAVRAAGASPAGRPRVASVARAALRASFHAARRTSSSASVAQLTTWNGSAQRIAFGAFSVRTDPESNDRHRLRLSPGSYRGQRRWHLRQRCRIEPVALTDNTKTPSSSIPMVSMTVFSTPSRVRHSRAVRTPFFRH